MNRNLTAGLSLGLAAILFLAVVILGNIGLRAAPRIDLTANGLYTLSKGTRNVLNSIKEPITLRLFFSEKAANDLPQIKVYAKRVRDIVEEYAARSGGKIRLEVIDPEPFSDAEDRAVAAGVQPVTLEQAGGGAFYFGLVGSNASDKREVIPFFQQDREQLLEYDLTRLVYTLTDPVKPVVGLMTDVPLQYGPGGIMAAFRGQSQPYAVYQALSEAFTVKTVALDAKRIDEDIKVLWIVHPKELPEATQYAIDQFVMHGGRVLLFVDPAYESEAGRPNPMGMQGPPVVGRSNLPRLMKAWGVELEEGKYVGDRQLAIRIQTGDGANRKVVNYLAWLGLGEANRSKDDVIVGELGDINLGAAGSLKKLDGAGTTFMPLLQSSAADAGLVSADQAGPGVDFDKLLGEFKPSGQRYVMAARVTGVAKSAFPDGVPKEAAEKKEGESAKEGEKPADARAHLAESSGPINVVVVADVDMLEDRFWGRSQNFFGQQVFAPFASNGNLAINAIENLSGSNDLISLRSRARSTRPFTRIDDLRREAGQEMLAREQELRKKLADTEKQLGELQTKRKPGAGVVTTEEQAAIETFRQDVIRIRKDLRDVQRNLNERVERLQTWIRVASIGFMPAAVALFAIGLGMVRTSRRTANRTRA